ncbi:MAG: AIR carboxylase family protein [Candidatus Omnitrophica bacterium]|nr:AIR carboxylase family protein [Candidatus Omnitrophota bacterium]
MGERIAIVLGSKSDLERLKDSLELIERLGIPYILEIISAHRQPEELRDFCRKLEKRGIKVVVACAGLACALPGFIASYVKIPVIGVPLEGGVLDGLDSLLSIVQVPKGVGLVSSGIGKRGFLNAIIFSLEILSLLDRSYYSKLSKLIRELNR